MSSSDDDDAEELRRLRVRASARQREMLDAGGGGGGGVFRGLSGSSLETLREKQRRLQEATAVTSHVFQPRDCGDRAVRGNARRPPQLFPIGVEIADVEPPPAAQLNAADNGGTKGVESSSKLSYVGKRGEDRKLDGKDDNDDDGDDDDDDGADDDQRRGKQQGGGSFEFEAVDEANLQEGLRKYFPLAFGQQEGKRTPLEKIHSQTRRESGKSAKGQATSIALAGSSGDGDVGRVGGQGGGGWERRREKEKEKDGGGVSSLFKMKSQEVKGAAYDEQEARNGIRSGGSAGRLTSPRSMSKNREREGGGDVEDAMPLVSTGMSERHEEEDDSGGDMVGLPRPPPLRSMLKEQNQEEEEDEGVMIGPPKPPPAKAGQEEEEEEEEEEDEGAMIGPPRPPPEASTGRDEDMEDGGEGPVMIGPARPPPEGQEGESDDDDDDDDDDEDDEDDDDDGDEYRIPMSNEIILGGHSKIVSAIAVDPTGSRVLTGSYDYAIRMYDFQGMDTRLRSFRQLVPSDGHQVRALSWSPTADRFLAVTGSSQAKIYDRDGLTLGEFLRGDMYIRDAKNTKGHIISLTSGEWHPREKNTVLTCSEDGTIRVWDPTTFKAAGQKMVIKPRLSRPGRVPITACGWGRDGELVVGGLSDGSLQLWSVRGKGGWGSRPDFYLEKGHEQGDDISGVCFSADGNMLLSRATDDTLKAWDLRRFNSPLKVFDDLPNRYAQTNVSFSPDERLILTGTSSVKGRDLGDQAAERSGRGGYVAAFDKDRLELVRKIGVSGDSSVVRVAWHPRLNQIFVGAGSKKQGGTHVLYDPTQSERGALVCVARAPRKKSAEDFIAPPLVIHNPHALQLFRDEPSRKRQREKARKDPIKSRRPEPPLPGPGHGGRVGASKGSLLTQYLLREGGLIKETWMEEDPREAILRHADAAKEEPLIFGAAYSRTQPEPVFQMPDDEEEDDKK
ncbi:hypothetical protein CBR_g29722 [Chara braunii]|uniref:Uncharacterized protein n=1 Tax=Chara braunii TaxID=69332 RepID=A0A388LB77_CHABU|nr:hypothetical protein CBR_g29722 [Chara braunii]|eukprot:GBG79575.1 hypothetical protein CBR_g29722 [Chara braunii]